MTTWAMRSCRATCKRSRASLSPSAARRLVELDDFEATREAARAIRQRALDRLDVWLEIFEKNATARGATVLWAETPAEVNKHVLDIAQAPRRAQDHQVEVDGQRGVGAGSGNRSGRRAGGRDRSGRVHPPDQRLRAAVAHHRPGIAQEQGGSLRPVRQGARHAAQDRDRRALSRGARRPAHALSDRRRWASPAAISSSPRRARWCW